MRSLVSVIKLLPLTLLATPAMASMTGGAETQKVQLADFSGKPPFKREVVELSVHDVAKLEALSNDKQPQKYVSVRTVNMSGKPPFRRTVETLPVYDVAQFEQVNQAEDATRTGRPPFKRF
ncbi:hypothetical protein [Salinimonas chungwhensis]|uniref:hypothetical protein n=1 Tax=Salinimonas chungwhensis TaxID=265425 RepID=UPI00037657F2|nr:hypothetical protein [Salinimonas chungwhensis]